MLSHESDTWILQRILRFEDAETWIRRHGLIYGSGDMDLAEDPEIHMDDETWIRRHGSCRGSWHTYGCLYTDPETWILQRSLRYKNAETWAQRRGSCRGSILVDAETWTRRHGSCRESWDTKMLRLRRHGSCRGSWDINGCWDMNAKTWIGHMDLAEDPEIRMDAYLRIRRHGSCRGAWDTKMLRHEPKDVDLVEDPYQWMLRHESEDMDLVENPEIRRCWDSGDMDLAEDPEI